MKQEKICKYRIIILVLFLVSLFISFSNLIVFGHSESSGVFDGMYMKYNFKRYAYGGFWENGSSKITYSYVSGDIYHATYTIKLKYYDDPVHMETYSWDEDIQTRIVSDPDYGYPWEGTYTWFWIFPNISLNDRVPIHIHCIYAEFNVTRQLTYKLSGYGSINVWELTEVNATAEHTCDQHLCYGPSVLWYENSTGILINGKFTWMHKNGEMTVGYQVYEFRGTNALPKVGEAAIPGYHYFLLISMFSIFGIVIIKWRKKVK